MCLQTLVLLFKVQDRQSKEFLSAANSSFVGTVTKKDDGTVTVTPRHRQYRLQTVQTMPTKCFLLTLDPLFFSIYGPKVVFNMP